MSVVTAQAIIFFASSSETPSFSNRSNVSFVSGGSLSRIRLWTTSGIASLAISGSGSLDVASFSFAFPCNFVVGALRGCVPHCYGPSVAGNISLEIRDGIPPELHLNEVRINRHPPSSPQRQTLGTSRGSVAAVAPQPIIRAHYCNFHYGFFDGTLRALYPMPEKWC